MSGGQQCASIFITDKSCVGRNEGVLGQFGNHLPPMIALAGISEALALGPRQAAAHVPQHCQPGLGNLPFLMAAVNAEHDPAGHDKHFFQFLLHSPAKYGHQDGKNPVCPADQHLRESLITSGQFLLPFKGRSDYLAGRLKTVQQAGFRRPSPDECGSD